MKWYRGILLLIAISLILVGVILFFLSLEKEPEFKLIPKQKIIEERVIEKLAGTEVGTGWSSKENPEAAVEEAVDMALAGKENKTPDMAIVFVTSGSDLGTIYKKLKEIFGKKTKIYGGTSDSRAVMTDKGFVKATQRGYEQALKEGKYGLAIMTITSGQMIFGVGSADLSFYPSAQEAGRAAMLQAIRDTAKKENKFPQIILLTPSIGVEEEILEGIESVVGREVPVLGGTRHGQQTRKSFNLILGHRRKRIG